MKRMHQQEADMDNAEVIEESYHPMKDWKMDKAGYFLIRVNGDSLEAGFCEKDNVIQKLFKAKDALTLYNIVLRHLSLSQQHAAYLGKELAKAELAMVLDISFVQDAPLDLRGIKKVKDVEPVENIDKHCLDTRSFWTK